MKPQEYLEKNPHVKQVFASSDGFLFLNEQDAKNHAKTLKDRNISTHQQKVKEFAENDIDSELNALELSPKNYNQMKVIAKKLGLDVVGKKAEHYIKALEEYKNTKSE